MEKRILIMGLVFLLLFSSITPISIGYKFLHKNLGKFSENHIPHTIIINYSSNNDINQNFLKANYLKSNIYWWNNDFLYRKKITIDHTKISENLNNFPILIHLKSDSELVLNAQKDGDDIAFTNQNCEKLYHEIEYYDSSNGELVCWVNVTDLSSTIDTTLYMYYGNPFCKSQQNISYVWDSNFILVHHLNENSKSHFDSTIYKNDGVSYGGVIQDISGQIDGGDEFNGIDGYIDCGLVSNTSIVGLLDGAHNVEINDVDNDGLNDLIACGFKANKVGWYKQISGNNWSEFLIDDNLLNAHDIQIGDIDNDGGDDVVGLSLSENPFDYTQGNGSLIWYQKPDNPTESWQKTIIKSSGKSGLTGSRSMGLGDIDSDGDLDIAVAVDACSYQNYGRLFWYQNPGGTDALNGDLWNEYLIDDTQNNGADSQISDIDNDGNPDIVFSCHQIKSNPYGVMLYFSPNNPEETENWERIGFSEDTSYHNYIIDFDYDGYLDILVAHWTSKKISWYKNPGSDIRNPLNWIEYIIDDSSEGIINTNRIIPYDVDLDGDLDILTVSDPTGSTGWFKWYERHDDPTNVLAYNMYIIDNDPSRTAWAHDGNVADIDNDGSVDIVGAGCNSDKVFVDYDIANKKMQFDNNITIEIWTNWYDLGASSVGLVGTYGTPAQTGYVLGKLSGETNLGFYPVGGITNCVKTTSKIPTDSFTQYIGTFNGSIIKIYKDGFLENSKTFIGKVSKNNQPIVIGRWYGNYDNYYFNGIIDEVRISNTARSSGWINTSYLNQQNPQTFIKIDKQEVISIKFSFIIGKVENITKINEFTYFNGINIHIIQLIPYKYQKFTSGEIIAVSKSKIGTLKTNFTIGFFYVAI